MGENYFFDLIREEGEAIGIVKGRDEGQAGEARKAILLVIDERFGSVPAEVRRRVEAIGDVARLEALLRTAVAAPTVDAFLGTLGGFGAPSA